MSQDNLVIATTGQNQKILIDKTQAKKRVSAYGVVINNNQLLLIKNKHSDKFWFPGGTLEKNEVIIDALKREVLEETNLLVEVTKKICSVESYFYYHVTNELFHQFSHFYICQVSKMVTLSAQNNPDTEDDAISPEFVDIKNLTEDKFQDYGFEILNKALL